MPQEKNFLKRGQQLLCRECILGGKEEEKQVRKLLQGPKRSTGGLAQATAAEVERRAQVQGMIPSQGNVLRNQMQESGGSEMTLGLGL